METETAATTEQTPAKTGKIGTALIAGLVIGVLAGGAAAAIHYLAIEPQEERAAFTEVVNSTDAQLRAKSLDELIDLDGKVFKFSVHAPGMMMPGTDANRRVDKAIAAKHGEQ